MGSGLNAELSGEEKTRTWKSISNVEASVLERHRNAMFARMNVTASAVEAAIGAAEQAGVDNNLPLATVGRAGLGALVLAFIPLSVDPPSAMQYANTISPFPPSPPQHSPVVVPPFPQQPKCPF